MSTRCQIEVSGEPVRLYKHSDGYPSGVMPILEKVVAEFELARGFFDGPYLLARIGQRFMNESDDGTRKFRDKMASAGLPLADNAESFVLGYGYDTEVHGDIEYMYTVHADFSISVKGE